MLSGFSGQSFTFHGYFPREEALLAKQLRNLSHSMTHLFIETPYRAEKQFLHLLRFLPPSALLCVAKDLTLPSEMVETFSVAQWREKGAPSFSKRPVTFALSFP
jgi:16S rRNA (cytidine1402-2'-O)-methyltransferase